MSSACLLSPVTCTQIGNVWNTYSVGSLNLWPERMKASLSLFFPFIFEISVTWLSPANNEKGFDKARFLQGLKTLQSLNHSVSFGWWWCYRVYCVIFLLYFVFQIRLHFKSALYHSLVFLFPSRTDPVTQAHIIIWTNWLISHCFPSKLMITVRFIKNLIYSIQ